MSTKCLPPEARKQLIIENILNHSYDSLAKMCRCTKKTIYRTVKEWRQEGGFDELLFDRFLQLYPKVEAEYPEKALDKLVYLMGKGMTQKQEIHTEGSLNISGLNEGINQLIEVFREENDKKNPRL